MPVWGQVILGIAAVVTALGVLWSKVIKPLLKFAKKADRMIPLLEKLTDAFIAAPDSFEVLSEIAAQFRTDSGSTLRDVVNRIERAAELNATSADVLAIELKATKTLAERDRQEVQRLMLQIDRVAERQKDVAANLVTAQTAVDGVASDLAESHRRADEVAHTEPAGSAADAASKASPTDEAQ